MHANENAYSLRKGEQMNTSKGRHVRVQGDHISLGGQYYTDLEGRQLIRVRRKKRRPIKRYVLTGLLLFLFLAS